jgi:hypothetical protein
MNPALMSSPLFLHSSASLISSSNLLLCYVRQLLTLLGRLSEPEPDNIDIYFDDDNRERATVQNQLS